MSLINKYILIILISLVSTVGFSQNLVPGGVNAGDDVTLDCTTGPCTDLVADFHQSHETNSRYTVTSLPMDPVAVTLPSSISLDDSYSPVISLGFSFCFFGEEKTEIVIGDNGLISFNLAYANVGAGNAQYTVPANAPSSQLPEDAVFGAYHDLYVPEGGEITYGVTGTAPFRAFVINYRNVAQYNAASGCNDPTTQQIVLHETSNFIDVYLTQKPACTGWQNGAAIVGIQKGAGVDGYVAPGRNKSDSPWTATDEAWRFAPEVNGAETFTFEWVNNTTGLQVSTNPTFNVCPTETTTYTANVTWINCTGATVSATDEIIVTVDLPFTLAIDGGNQTFCVGDPAYTINATTTTTAGVSIVSYNWYEITSPSVSLGTTSSISVNVSGTYVIEVTDSGGCTLTEQVQIDYNPAPNAGSNGTINFCSSDASTDLFTALGGTPDAGGTWTPTLTSGTGVFNPLIDAVGTYTYTVAGFGSCADATATITVDVTTAPNAGTSAFLGFCSTDAPVDLFASLGGTPETGGTWTPALASGTGVFDPSVDADGVYTYTIAATGYCTTDATATVTTSVDIAPNAGTDNTINLCSTDASVDLFTLLGGTPETGGTWTPTLTSGTGVFDPLVDTAGVYTYSLTGGVCATATAQIDVTLDIAPNAGTDNTINLCTTDASVDLFTLLGGTPDTGGTWTPTLASGTGIFDPLTDTAGIYTYTVLGSGVCVAVTAQINVTLNTAPNAGTDNTINLCSSDVAVDLFTELGGSPDTGGVWAPTLTSGTGVFDPSVDAPGSYTYTVTGNGACTDVSAVVTTVVTAAANAGTAITIADICDTETTLSLFTGLTGYDTTGTWSDDDASGGLTGNNLDATGLSGTYNFTYTVPPTSPCSVADSETVTVTVIQSPVSGTATANMEVCNTDAAVDLGVGLTGADSGGTWNDNDATGGLTNNMFDPTGLATGTYNFTYTVAATAPCVDASTTIAVEVTAAANAGTAITIADICDTETTLSLFTGLTGYDTTGTWSDDDASGGLTGNNLDATGLSGTYNFTYTVPPTSPCSVADSETVTVTVIRSPVSGTVTANMEVCNTDAAVDLGVGLTGADSGGTWNDNDATGGLTNNMFDPTGLATGTYNFTYTVAATAPCVDASTTIAVEVTAAANAGTAITIADICDVDSVDLTIGLTGADSGGTWTDDDLTGGLTGSVFDATGLTAGTYNFTYTVPLTNPCTTADAETVQVTVIRSPDAGVDSEVSFCMADNPTDLYTVLGGSPDLGGTWTPSMISNSGVFDPAHDSAGTYTYTVSGTGACNPTSATVIVSLSESPVITSIDIVDFSENNTITVGVEGGVSGTSFGIGDYEYSIDGSSFQSENTIENVSPGTYTVTVRDANGCLPNAFQTGVIVMGAPKFFTPNNDGKNDTWQIYNIQSQPNAIIDIYDKFGKFIKRIDPVSDGWDGYYNGESLPSSDYWFNVYMNDSDGNPVTRKGHFSLIRR